MLFRSVYATNTQGNYTGTTATTYSVQTSTVTGAAPGTPSIPVISNTMPAYNSSAVSISSGGSSSAGTPSTTTYAYNWQRCTTSDCDTASGNTAISVGTGSTYTPSSADVGYYLRVQVTASNTQGAYAGTSTIASSAVTAYAMGAAPSAPSTPVLSTNSPVNGTSLNISSGATTSTGTPSASSYDYTWQDSPDGSAWSTATGAGATSSTYTPNSNDIGKYLRVQVTATSSQGAWSGTSPVATSAATTTTGTAPTVSQVAATAITPTSAVLSGSINPNSEETTYYFQYGLTNSYGQTVQAVPVDIGSGSDPVLASQALTGVLAGTVYHYRLVAVSFGGTSVSDDQTFQTPPMSVTPPPTPTPVTPTPVTLPVIPPVAVVPGNTGLPVVKGKAKSKSKLTASSGRWSGGVVTYRYQWKACDVKGKKCKAIRGATKTVLTLTRKNVGQRLEITVTATNTAGSVSATSKPTPVVKS